MMKPGCLILLLLLPVVGLYGQSGFMLYRHPEKPMQLSVNGNMQIWLRHTSLNPGSLVKDEPRSSLSDLSLRRYRLNFNGQLSDKLRVHFSMGNNNLNYYSLKQNYFRVLDAYVDYQLNESLGIGFGKNAWTGLSRYSAPATTQTLAYDINFAAIPFIEVHDDILRRLAVYARGRYGKLDFRLALARPVNRHQPLVASIGEHAGFTNRRPAYQLSSYIKYQFLEIENQSTPFAAGTYLGKKNIFNLGVGTLYQPQTSWRMAAADTLYEAATSVAVDLFYEKALKKNQSVTFYAALFYHRLGKNFIRNIGVNNPANGHIGAPYLNATGNSTPLVGTGITSYAQLGYLMPVGRRNTRQLQPFLTFQYGRLQALDDAAVIYESGFNYYLNSQRSKISFGYQSRPVFIHTDHEIRQEARKGMAVLQYQFVLGN